VSAHTAHLLACASFSVPQLPHTFALLSSLASSRRRRKSAPQLLQNFCPGVVPAPHSGQPSGASAVASLAERAELMERGRELAEERRRDREQDDEEMEA
jgi:hypothetical protein